MQASDLNLIYAGTRDLPDHDRGQRQRDQRGRHGGRHEVRPPKWWPPSCDAQLEAAPLLGLPDKVVKDIPVDASLLSKARELGGADLKAALRITGKLERQDKVSAVKESLKAKMKAFPEMTEEQFFQLFDALEIEVTRASCWKTSTASAVARSTSCAPLAGRSAPAPRPRFGSMFNRGETQALATVTLGTADDAQDLDAIAGGPDREEASSCTTTSPPTAWAKSAASAPPAAAKSATATWPSARSCP
jgi:hypothetical protein